MSTYVVVGSVCWDVVEGGGARLGGSALFSGRVALARGWDLHVVTSGTPELEAAVRAALPEATVTVQPSPADTVFEFSVDVDRGPSGLRSRAARIDLAGVDLSAGAEVVHLAPVFGELEPASLAGGVRGDLVGLTPQGLLRSTHPETGALLRHGHLDPWWADQVDVVVLSDDEIALFEDPTVLDGARAVVTEGADGCRGTWGDEVVDVPGIPVPEASAVGTIGAGDTFAAACFIALAEGASFADALVEANRTAAAHVGGRAT